MLEAYGLVVESGDRRAWILRLCEDLIVQRDLWDILTTVSQWPMPAP